MPEAVVTTSPSTETQISPQPNTPEARTSDGTIKDQSQTQSTKPVGETAPDAAATTTTTSAEPQAYTEFKTPAGTTLDATAISSAVPIFRELGLNQDQAQKLVDFYSKQQLASKSATDTAINTMRQTWRDGSMSDPEIGPNVERIQADLGRMYNHIIASDPTGGPKLVADFKSVMTDYAVGDNPTVVKMMARIAKSFGEGKHVTGGGPSISGQTKPGATDRSPAQTMYPNLPSSSQAA